MEPVDVAALWREFARTPGSTAVVVTVVLPFIIVSIAGAARFGWVMCPGLFLCAALTVVIPIQHSGEPLALKRIAAKIAGLIAGDLRYGSLKSMWYSRGLSLLFTGAALGARIIALRNAAPAPIQTMLGINVPPVTQLF
jgi:hypothetical protein